MRRWPLLIRHKRSFSGQLLLIFVRGKKDFQPSARPESEPSLSPLSLNPIRPILCFRVSRIHSVIPLIPDSSKEGKLSILIIIDNGRIVFESISNSFEFHFAWWMMKNKKARKEDDRLRCVGIVRFSRINSSDQTHRIHLSRLPPFISIQPLFN